MELKPWEFGELQPHEFMALWDGYQWRRKNNDDTLAYYVCQLINISGKMVKEPVQPEQISRFRENPEEKKKSDEEHLKEQFKDILKNK